MNDKKVKVLLSAYNGEKYIAAQVDSILAQTYDNIELYIRDDGSKDHTLEVLAQYEGNERIHIIKGENVGFIDSFLTLVRDCGEADYYAFCDQDDVWFEYKIQYALEKLGNTDESKPCMYFSNYDYYDSELNFLSHHVMHPKISFRNALVDCISLGFNTVFNKKTRNMIAKRTPKHSCGHDWWVYMLCTGLGQVVFDQRVTAKYRRHANNVSDGGQNFIKFQIWRIKKFILNNYFKNIRVQMKEYEQLYGSRLNESDRKLLSMFTKDGFHPGNTLKKVF